MLARTIVFLLLLLASANGVTNYQKDPFSMTMSILLFIFSSLLVLSLSYFTGYAIGKCSRL